MSSRLPLIGVGLCLLLAQQLVMVALPEWGRPDLVLAFALAMGLRSRPTSALLLAFAIGYAVDALSAAPVGLYALLRGTACAATRLLDRALYLRAPLPWGIYVAVCAVADALLLGACLRLVGAAGSPAWADLLLGAAGPALVTGLAAAPLLLLLQRLDGQSAPEEAWSSLSSRGARL